MRDALVATVAALYLAACSAPMRPEEQSTMPRADPEICDHMWQDEYSGTALRSGNTLIFIDHSSDIDSGDRLDCIFEAVTHPSRHGPFMNSMVRLYGQLIDRGNRPEEARATVVHVIQEYVRGLAEFGPEYLHSRAELGQRHTALLDSRIGNIR